MLRHLLRSVIFAQPAQCSLAVAACGARSLSTAATTLLTQLDKLVVYTEEEGYIRQSPFEPVEPVNLTVDKYVWRDFKKFEKDIATVSCEKQPVIVQFCVGIWQMLLFLHLTAAIWRLCDILLTSVI